MDLLYVVLQFAEEDLSQVLPERALTAAEAREMSGPLLEGLSYIHEKGFVHGHLAPANILAADNNLKLATDTIIPSGTTRPSSRTPDVYDAPETESIPLSASSDVWSLGVTLIEVLTQRPPVMPLDNQSNPTFPDTLPQPFLDIARHSLRRDAKRRWTTAEIAMRLNETASAAAAGQTQSSSPVEAPAVSRAATSPAAVSPGASPAATPAASSSTLAPVTAVPAAVSPLAMRESNAPAVPRAKLPTTRYEGPSQPVPARPQPARAGATPRKQTVLLPNYVVPIVATALVIGAIFVLPKILGSRPASSSTAASASAASQSKTATQSPEPQPAAKSARPSSLKTATGKNPSKASTPSPSAAPASAALRTDSFPSANAGNPSSASPTQGNVLDQVLPDVSEKARATIQGRVRVAVRAHVDAAGVVSDAEFDSRGPSQYFADVALKAARRWEFTPPEIGGRSVPSEWLIRFEFSQSGTKASPKQIAP
jgi:TonB family protein